MNATLTVTPTTLEDSHDGSHEAILSWASSGADGLTLTTKTVTSAGTMEVSQPLSTPSGSVVLRGLRLGQRTFELVATAIPAKATATLNVIPHHHEPDPDVHPDDPAKQAEHLAMLALVTPQTADLYVPKGQIFNVLQSGASFSRVRVDGTLLLFGRLTTDTVICDAGSILEMYPGAGITFTDTGPITDPLMLGRGLISHGTVKILGTYVAPDKERARNWKPGDAVNLSRSIVFESQATEVSRRGHVMFMHTGAVHVEGALFRRIGRTDKSRPVTDPVAGNLGSLANPRGRYAVHFHRAGGTKTSQPAVCRGCAVVDSPGWGIVNHSSHVLIEDNETYNIDGGHIVTELGNEIGTIKGNVCIYGKGGNRGTVDNDFGNDDWAHGGHGVWIQGGGMVEVADNTYTGFKDGAEVWMGLKPVHVDLANVPDELIARGIGQMWPYPTGKIGSQDVPIRSRRNTAFNSDRGLVIWANHNPGYHNVKSIIEDFQAIGCTDGLLQGYPGKLHFKRLKLVGDVANPRGLGIWHTGVTFDCEYDDCEISGFLIGAMTPTSGDNVWRGGRFANVVDFFTTNKPWSSRKLHFDGNQTFDLVTNLNTRPNFNGALLGNPGERFNHYLGMHHVWFDIRGLMRNPPDAQTLQYVWTDQPFGYSDEIKVGNEFLSFEEQGRSHSLAPYIGLSADLRSKTIGQVAADHGLYLGKKEIPADAVKRQGTRGWYHTQPAVSK